MITKIDIEIIQLLADGFTQKEMAALMHLPEGTVETYRHRLFRKIKVKNAPNCVQWAFRNKVLN